MHDDPTHRMGPPPGGGESHPEHPAPDGEPRRGGLSTGIKTLLAVLVAGVLGLGIALAVVAADTPDDPEVVTTTETAPAETITTTITPDPATTTTTETTTETTTVAPDDGGTP